MYDLGVNGVLWHVGRAHGDERGIGGGRVAYECGSGIDVCEIGAEESGADVTEDAGCAGGEAVVTLHNYSAYPDKHSENFSQYEEWGTGVGKSHSGQHIAFVTTIQFPAFAPFIFIEPTLVHECGQMPGL